MNIKTVANKSCMHIVDTLKNQKETSIQYVFTVIVSKKTLMQC